MYLVISRGIKYKKISLISLSISRLLILCYVGRLSPPGFSSLCTLLTRSHPALTELSGTAPATQAQAMQSREVGHGVIGIEQGIMPWAGAWDPALAAQSLATNSPAPGPRPLTCGVSSECLGTRSYETTSRDQRGKIQMFFSSTGACAATKSPIANHRSSIVPQLHFASVTQMFLVPLFVKVESGSSKLLRTASKSGPNGCKERSRLQKMLMRIKIESV